MRNGDESFTERIETPNIS